MHIGREDPQPSGIVLHRGRFVEQHGQRIRLFTRGAARDPDANLRLVHAPAHQRRNDVRTEMLEHPLIPEERRHPDEQIVQQRIGFLPIVAQQRQVVRQPGDGVLAHPPLQTAKNRALFVQIKFDAVGGLQVSQDGLIGRHLFALGRRTLPWLVMHPPIDRERQGPRITDHVGAHGIQRTAGHPGKLRFARVLNEHRATGLIHRLDPRLPSEPVPVRITAAAWEPYVARLRKN